MVGELGNFWWLGQLGQVWGNIEVVGKCIGVWGR